MFSASGRVITFHGFLKAYVEGTDDSAARRRPGDPSPGARRGRPGHRRVAVGGRPRDQAAVAVHRGHADQGARGPRDRPPLDVRLDHRHHPQPRLRLQEGHRPGAGLAGVLRDQAAGGPLHAGWCPTSSPPRWRTSSTTSPAAARTRSPSSASSTSAPTPSTGLHPLVNGLGDIDAKELATFPIGGDDSGIALRVGKYGPYLEGPGDDGEAAAKRANVPEDLPPTS